MDWLDNFQEKRDQVENTIGNDLSVWFCSLYVMSCLNETLE